MVVAWLTLIGLVVVGLVLVGFGLNLTFRTSRKPEHAGGAAVLAVMSGPVFVLAGLGLLGWLAVSLWLASR